ncbi:MAG TPA: DUF3558 domain-containing protein [Pseudonocardiaceae bacterium]|nr:DUF3558 domain-containing protein [Pseudonocardiaceae bacterium]
MTLAAGCASSGTPTAGPTSNDSTPTTSTSPKSEISDPLDLTKFSANVCNGLTATQVAPYLATVGTTKVQQTNNGPVCSVLPTDISKPTLGVGVVNIATPTQELLYEAQSSFPWRQKISPIAGYPAVNASQGNGPPTGDCATDVAVNATQSLHIEFTDTEPSGQYYNQPCAPSEALMAELIQNIKSGSA